MARTTTLPAQSTYHTARSPPHTHQTTYAPPGTAGMGQMTPPPFAQPIRGRGDTPSGMTGWVTARERASSVGVDERDGGGEMGHIGERVDEAEGEERERGRDPIGRTHATQPVYPTSQTATLPHHAPPISLAPVLTSGPPQNPSSPITSKPLPHRPISNVDLPSAFAGQAHRASSVPRRASGEERRESGGRARSEHGGAGQGQEGGEVQGEPLRWEKGKDLTGSLTFTERIIPWISKMPASPTRQSWMDKEDAQVAAMERGEKVGGGDTTGTEGQGTGTRDSGKGSGGKASGGREGVAGARQSIPSDAMSRGANKPGAKAGQMHPQLRTQPLSFDPLPTMFAPQPAQVPLPGSSARDPTPRIPSVDPPSVADGARSGGGGGDGVPGLSRFWPGSIPMDRTDGGRYPFPYPLPMGLPQQDGYPAQYTYMGPDGRPMADPNMLPGQTFSAEASDRPTWWPTMPADVTGAPSSTHLPGVATTQQATVGLDGVLSGDQQGTISSERSQARLEEERARALEQLAGSRRDEKKAEKDRKHKHKKHSSERKEKRSKDKKHDKKDRHKHKDGKKSSKKTSGEARHHHHHHRSPSDDDASSHTATDRTAHLEAPHDHHHHHKKASSASEWTDESSRKRSESVLEVPAPKRDTRQTETSGPSFGHFGRPFSYDVPPGVHLAEEFLDDDLGSPFDMLGQNVPIMVLGGSGAIPLDALGLGLGGLGSAQVRQPDARSAYVETVDDEDDPDGLRPASSRHSQGRTPDRLPFMAELRVSDNGPDASSRSVRGSKPPSVRDSTRSRGSGDPPQQYPAIPTLHRHSTAMSTVSMVESLANKSKFHDEALCQLLHAARSPGIGEVAKKAIRGAAKARLVELARLQEAGQLQPGMYLPAENKQSSPPMSPKDQQRLKELDDGNAPVWSQALFDMLSLTNARLAEVEQRLPLPRDQSETAPSVVPTQDEAAEQAARAALHNILFPGHPVPMGQSSGGEAQAYYEQAPASGHNMQPQPGWGPQLGGGGGALGPAMYRPPFGYQGAPGSVPAPQPRNAGSTAGVATAPGPPSIHVQPPTANGSNQGEARSDNQATPRANSRAIAPDTDPGTAGGATPPPAPPRVNRGVQAPSAVETTPAKTSDPPQQVQPQNDPLCPPLPYPRPWDIVTQRLFSWALVWMQDDFVRTLETIALGGQVDEFALTIYSMMTFKRNLRHRMCANPPMTCDKLFVPPNMSDAINRAVHAKRFDDAQQILTELWYPFGFHDPPRVIVALAKHRNEPDHWAAHRFDLPTARLTTLSFLSEEKSLIDGRPFMWWHAIRQAWPQHNIPHPDHLAQKNSKIIVPPEQRGDNSLAACNASRNLLLGWRPDRSTDLDKLRNLVWQEVKRLYNRKVAGKLVIEPGQHIPDDM